MKRSNLRRIHAVMADVAHHADDGHPRIRALLTAEFEALADGRLAGPGLEPAVELGARLGVARGGLVNVVDRRDTELINTCVHHDALAEYGPLRSCTAASSANGTPSPPSRAAPGCGRMNPHFGRGT